ncbi:MAG: carboxylating nicotinate-nucleotide diphosphorylase [Ignavibacteria bacterium]|nr:carboxylating nicotinate-nucleotide diphosphorylase [Ignavibacteria bacterium]
MTVGGFYRKFAPEIRSAVRAALREDKVDNDITTSLIGKLAGQGKRVTARLLCKSDCVLAGIEVFKLVFKELDKKVNFKIFFSDGMFVWNNEVVLSVRSDVSALLRAERTALNFIQRMSGIATITSEFVKKLKYKNAKILHTRKTTPNFRLFEVIAVKTGGGDFHRLGLDSSLLIKDNHIIAAGGISKILKHLKKKARHRYPRRKYEIEVKNLEEASLVAKDGLGIIDTVMLDNFHPEDIHKATEILKGFKIEVSGGINLENFEKYQHRKVDFYSIGMLTHSYKSADFSLEF